MDKRIFFVTIAVVIAFAAAGRKHIVPAARSVEIAGDMVTADYGKRHIAGILGEETTRSFIINNGFLAESGLACFAVFSLEQAESLKERYGDFMQCGSPGESAGKRSIYTIYIIPENNTVEKEIAALMKKRLNSPLIEIDAWPLDVRDNTYGGTRYVSREKEEYFLARCITVIQDTYR